MASGVEAFARCLVQMQGQCPPAGHDLPEEVLSACYNQFLK